MSNQLTYFQEYIEKVKGFVGKEKAEHIISKGLALVVAGSDDLANTYYGEHLEEFLYDIDTYTSFMASSAASFAMVRETNPLIQLFIYGLDHQS